MKIFVEKLREIKFTNFSTRDAVFCPRLAGHTA